jgi:RING finger protein 113A
MISYITIFMLIEVFSNNLEMSENVSFTKRQKRQKLSIDDQSSEPKITPKSTPLTTSLPSSNPSKSLFSYTPSEDITINPSEILSIDPDDCPITAALTQKSLSSKIFSGELSASVYRGQKAYAQYAEKSESSIRASKFTGSLGPVKAPSHLKATCRFDYSYGLCKDWRISGYCGYGESCIFVHDRSELKTGWELEKEWEKDQESKRKKALDLKDLEPSNPPPELKEKGCLKCEGPKEITTLCKHEFCLKCSMEQFAHSPKCYICGKDTKGIFNEIKSEEKNPKNNK